MSNKKINILIVFFLLTNVLLSQNINCKISESSIDSVNQLLNLISESKEKYHFDYNHDKATLIFNKLEGEDITGFYKLISNDIHPEGIFLVDKDDKLYIKIISKCNGNVFIKTIYKKKFPLSRSINIALLGPYSQGMENGINLICEILTRNLYSCIGKETEDNSSEIIIPPLKKRN